MTKDHNNIANFSTRTPDCDSHDHALPDLPIF